ncbi:uncharacterized protein Dana_GF12785 [Drosophila ananassae]|uniref:Uncharacterized protein n=1 Tax=Drosophila ananassae TaxID=7217 RepID=B3MBG0_DROAN|nr:uncharacterized protein LOC6495631 [Drosophila ananassae]EDV36085.1 uncharacterized protein Dana_GF12785 [Drosophila ananassae]
MFPEAPPPKKKNLVCLTYGVTIGLLIIGQLQVLACVELDYLNLVTIKHVYISLGTFFISFFSIQLYGFFYHILVKKPWYVRFLAGFLTFEATTVAIMKPTRNPTYLCIIISIILTYLMMLIGWIYGNVASKYRKGCFTSRLRAILRSEQIYALTCFGIIVCAGMKRTGFELCLMLVCTMISNVFIVIFAASIRRHYFYREYIVSDYIFIGQLYYLNCYTLCMSYVWTLSCLLKFVNWDAMALNIIF